MFSPPRVRATVWLLDSYNISFRCVESGISIDLPSPDTLVQPRDIYLLFDQRRANSPYGVIFYMGVHRVSPLEKIVLNIPDPKAAGEHGDIFQQLYWRETI